MELPEITKFIDEELIKLERQLEKFRERRGDPELYFSDMGLDTDGEPISFGNADYVYSDGIDAGEKSGRYELLLELKAKLSG